jgi:hypothetical protein
MLIEGPLCPLRRSETLGRPPLQVQGLRRECAAQRLERAIAADAARVQRLVQPVDRVDRDAVQPDDRVAPRVQQRADAIDDAADGPRIGVEPKGIRCIHEGSPHRVRA